MLASKKWLTPKEFTDPNHHNLSVIRLQPYNVYFSSFRMQPQFASI